MSAIHWPVMAMIMTFNDRTKCESGLFYNQNGGWQKLDANDIPDDR